MSPEEYEEAKGILVDALPVICGALSEHIQQRHAKLINQYKILRQERVSVNCLSYRVEIFLFIDLAVVFRRPY